MPKPKNPTGIRGQSLAQQLKALRPEDPLPLTTLTVGQFLEVMTDWHVDEITDRRAARRYADRALLYLMERQEEARRAN